MFLRFLALKSPSFDVCDRNHWYMYVIGLLAISAHAHLRFFWILEKTANLQTVQGQTVSDRAGQGWQGQAGQCKTGPGRVGSAGQDRTVSDRARQGWQGQAGQRKTGPGRVGSAGQDWPRSGMASANNSANASAEPDRGVKSRAGKSSFSGPDQIRPWASGSPSRPMLDVSVRSRGAGVWLWRRQQVSTFYQSWGRAVWGNGPGRIG